MLIIRDSDMLQELEYPTFLECLQETVISYKNYSILPFLNVYKRQWYHTRSRISNLFGMLTRDSDILQELSYPTFLECLQETVISYKN